MRSGAVRTIRRPAASTRNEARRARRAADERDGQGIAGMSNGQLLGLGHRFRQDETQHRAGQRHEPNSYNRGCPDVSLDIARLPRRDARLRPMSCI